MSLQLEEYIPGTIWICRYPVSYMGKYHTAAVFLSMITGGMCCGRG
jgi:hypothetical protein